MKHQNNIYIIIFLACIFFFGNKMHAENFGQRKFIQITAVENISSEGIYLIGALNNKTGEIYFMSHEAPSGKKKLIGKSLSTTSDNKQITTAEETLFWSFSISSSDEASIQSSILTLDREKGICLNKANALGIELKTKSFTTWKIYPAETAGLFNIQGPIETNRYLSLNYSPDNYFDNYSSGIGMSNEIFIYKALDEEFTNLPESGQMVTLACENYISDKNFCGIDNEPYILIDNSFAQSSSLTIMEFNWTSEKTFSLKNQNGNFLDRNLDWTQEETNWTIKDGNISTAEETSRGIRFRKNKFEVSSDQEGAVATFAILAKAASWVKSENGELLLNGGWDANSLSSISLENVSVINLTSALLPQYPQAFHEDIEQKNIPIYVSENQKEYVPETWQFIITCNEEGNYLLRKTDLIDRETIYIPFAFQVEEKQLYYSRNVICDGWWETLCLPFDATLPQDLHAEMLKKTTTETLTFEEVNYIPANTPVIIRYFGEPFDGIKEFTFESKENKATTDGNNGFYLFGNYQDFTLSDTDENIFLLNAKGDAFVLAQTGSHLDPFRCYLKVTTNNTKFKLPQVVADNINNPSIYSDKKQIYTIDGRRTEKLNQKGVYIISGKTYLK